MGLFSFLKNNEITDEKNDEKKTKFNVKTDYTNSYAESDEFEYKPLEHFVNFLAIHDPEDKDENYTIVMKIYDINDERNMYTETKDEHGNLIKRFVPNESQDINEILLKRVTIKEMFKGENASYRKFLENYLRGITNSINNAVMSKDMIKSDNPELDKDRDGGSTNQEKMYITTLNDISEAFSAFSEITNDFAVNLDTNNGVSYPYECQNMPDGDAFDACYRNPNYDKDKDSLTSSEKEDIEKNYPYDMKSSKDFKIRKKFKRIFSDEKKEAGRIAVVAPDKFREGLKSDVWPPEETKPSKTDESSKNAPSIESPDIDNK